MQKVNSRQSHKLDQQGENMHGRYVVFAVKQEFQQQTKQKCFKWGIWSRVSSNNFICQATVSFIKDFTIPLKTQQFQTIDVLCFFLFFLFLAEWEEFQDVLFYECTSCLRNTLCQPKKIALKNTQEHEHMNVKHNMPGGTVL